MMYVNLYLYTENHQLTKLKTIKTNNNCFTRLLRGNPIYQLPFLIVPALKMINRCCIFKAFGQVIS